MRTSIPAVIDSLNPEQREAVLAIDGPLLVLAGAGTGKTRVVTVRIAWMLERGIEAGSILAVTFTNKAAREMKERVLELVGRERGSRLVITTFHSFALRLLRRYGEATGFRAGFTIADEEDRQQLLRELLREAGISEKVVAPRAALFRISGWKNEGIGPDEALASASDDFEDGCARVYGAANREMQKRQTVDFDDMILLGLRLFREHPEVLDACRDRFHRLLVDEYQDTNGTQYELIRLLAGPRRHLCVVGDDDQSIYGWRGARAGNILDFARHYPGAKTVALTQNYRSTMAILAAANAVIGNNAARREKDLWSARGQGDPVRLYEAADERDEILRLCARIGGFRRDGARCEDIAVLFRANTQSAPIEAAFRERRIPYRVVGTRSLFDRRECKDLIAWLKLAANPKDDGALLRVINTPPRGIGRGLRDQLLEEAARRRVPLLEVVRAPGGSLATRGAQAAALSGFAAIVDEVASTAASAGVGAALERLAETIGYEAFLGTESKDAMEARARWNVVQDLIRIARGRDERGGADGIAGFLEMLALDDRDAGDDEGTGVTLMTVHAAKGLEFEHVLVVGVEETIFPHANSFDDDEGEGTIDEERRLFYVAITRARRTLDLSLAKSRRRWGRDEARLPSRFIEEIGDERLLREDASSAGPAEDGVAQDFLSRLQGIVGRKAEAAEDA